MKAFKHLLVGAIGPVVKKHYLENLDDLALARWASISGPKAPLRRVVFILP